MPNDLVEIENDLRNAVQEKRQVVEQIDALRQHIHIDESWLTRNTTATMGYQETLEELVALQSYMGELQSQAVAFDDILLELSLEREAWYNPNLLLTS